MGTIFVRKTKGNNTMSQQTATSFIQKVYADEALRNQVIALGQNTNGLLQLAASQGFTFSADDFQAAVRAAGYGGGEELSEAELANVAGGAGTGDSQWTGCSSGQSGCITTNTLGCATVPQPGVANNC